MNGYIDGELYVSCDNAVHKLKKSLYGLKQSARLCFEKLKKMLEEIGFKQHVS